MNRLLKILSESTWVFLMAIAFVICPQYAIAEASRLSAMSTLELAVDGLRLNTSNGESTLVPSDASALALNVTSVNPSSEGYLTVWPCGMERPLASNLNFSRGQIVPNGVIAAIGEMRKICVFAFTETDLVVDVSGWFEGNAFEGVTPKRVVDTRSESSVGSVNSLSPNQAESVSLFRTQLGSISGLDLMELPSTASAVALNATIVNPANPGFLTVYSCDAELPLASNINYARNQTVANGVIVELGTSQEICFFSNTSTDLVVDVLGWFNADNFTSVTPKRFVDTRNGTGGTARRIDSRDELRIPIHGVNLQSGNTTIEVPESASAAAINVAAVNPSGPGFVTIYPCNSSRPFTSNLNFNPGETRANNVIAPIGTDGDICVFTSVGTHLILDVSGWLESEQGFVGATPKRLVDTRVENQALEIADFQGGGFSISGSVAVFGPVTFQFDATNPTLVSTAQDFTDGPLEGSANVLLEIVTEETRCIAYHGSSPALNRPGETSGIIEMVFPLPGASGGDSSRLLITLVDAEGNRSQTLETEFTLGCP